ncbi:MAG: hypothetical protein E5Y65_00035 [Mesorhizobium sp.]|nr:MAG: hypothetical protein E5Y70_25045 [Mesorhizobium sp.]TIL94163.1 MAG: hypothetical protein E5Y65_00035 [Mesorhizobium sp.]TIM03052.1 MAG: hypothetical protein E5Y64_06290 [Mesorhizobium sp.]
MAVGVSAAPHRPAGHFSPYSDGEKGLAAMPAPFFRTLVIGETVDDSAPLPVIRGEDAGRQVRGSANARHHINSLPVSAARDSLMSNG